MQSSLGAPSRDPATYCALTSIEWHDTDENRPRPEPIAAVPVPMVSDKESRLVSPSRRGCLHSTQNCSAKRNVRCRRTEWRRAVSSRIASVFRRASYPLDVFSAGDHRELPRRPQHSRPVLPSPAVPGRQALLPARRPAPAAAADHQGCFTGNSSSLNTRSDRDDRFRHREKPWLPGGRHLSQRLPRFRPTTRPMNPSPPGERTQPP